MYLNEVNLNPDRSLAHYMVPPPNTLLPAPSVPGEPNNSVGTATDSRIDEYCQINVVDDGYSDRSSATDRIAPDTDDDERPDSGRSVVADRTPSANGYIASNSLPQSHEPTMTFTAAKSRGYVMLTAAEDDNAAGNLSTMAAPPGSTPTSPIRPTPAGYVTIAGITPMI